jgi:hypothetical protein
VRIHDAWRTASLTPGQIPLGDPIDFAMFSVARYTGRQLAAPTPRIPHTVSIRRRSLPPAALQPDLDLPSQTKAKRKKVQEDSAIEPVSPIPTPIQPELTPAKPKSKRKKVPEDSAIRPVTTPRSPSKPKKVKEDSAISAIQPLFVPKSQKDDSTQSNENVFKLSKSAKIENHDKIANCLPPEECPQKLSFLDNDRVVLIDATSSAATVVLDRRLRRGLAAEFGIATLFPLQAYLLEEVERGRRLRLDCCVASPTGSGKTLCFALPILSRLAHRIVPRIRALVRLDFLSTFWRFFFGKVKVFLPRSVP